MLHRMLTISGHHCTDGSKSNGRAVALSAPRTQRAQLLRTSSTNDNRMTQDAARVRADPLTHKETVINLLALQTCVHMIGWFHWSDHRADRPSNRPASSV